MTLFKRYSHITEVNQKIRARLEGLKSRRLQGKSIEIEKEFANYPDDVVGQLKKDFEGWENIQEHRGTFDLIASLPPIDEHLAEIHKQLDLIELTILERVQDSFWRAFDRVSYALLAFSRAPATHLRWAYPIIVVCFIGVWGLSLILKHPISNSASPTQKVSQTTRMDAVDPSSDLLPAFQTRNQIKTIPTTAETRDMVGNGSGFIERGSTLVGIPFKNTTASKASNENRPAKSPWFAQAIQKMLRFLIPEDEVQPHHESTAAERHLAYCFTSNKERKDG